MQIKRYLGLPGWFAASALDTPATLWLPRFSLDIAHALHAQIGRPRRIDAAMELSGQNLCLLYYEGERDARIETRLISFAIRDFVQLWHERPRALDALTPLGEITLTLWLENTTTQAHLVDDDHRVIVLSQRNGTLMAAEIAPRPTDPVTADPA